MIRERSSESRVTELTRLGLITSRVFQRRRFRNKPQAPLASLLSRGNSLFGPHVQAKSVLTGTAIFVLVFLKRRQHGKVAIGAVDFDAQVTNSMEPAIGAKGK